MRETCMFCVTKHLSQATILLGEVVLGYPQHIHLAIGHMAEAEHECSAEHLEFANKIRAKRLILMGQDEKNCIKPTDMMDLIAEAREIAEGINGISEEERIMKIMCSYQKSAIFDPTMWVDQGPDGLPQESVHIAK